MQISLTVVAPFARQPTTDMTPMVVLFELRSLLRTTHTRSPKRRGLNMLAHPNILHRKRSRTLIRSTSSAATISVATIRQIFNTFYAMGLVGATIEEVDAYGTLKISYSQFDSLTGNLLMTDQAIASSLIGSGDMYSANMPNFRAVFGSTIITDPTQIDWSYQGSPLRSNWTNTIFEESGTSGLVSHALTYYVTMGQPTISSRLQNRVATPSTSPMGRVGRALTLLSITRPLTTT